ncbi:MAG: NAD(+) synthase [Thermoplasmata archaeon]|nr:NAD(+) synthase [Thermoplasmata archaeon]
MIPLDLPDVKESVKIAVDFLKEILEESGADGFVVGLSGGLDSSVVALLLEKGDIPFAGVFLPEGEPSVEDQKSLKALESRIGRSVRQYNIEEPKNAIMRRVAPDKFGTMVEGNLSARMRMCYLYTIANSENLLVAGTSNKSEILIGYFTKWGDGAADIYPIGDLFKTQVYRLAKQLDVPEEIIKRPPTAGLLPGQTDEKEIGMSYEVLDRILYGLILGYDPHRISEEVGVPDEKVFRIMEMIRRSRHKRMGLLIPKMGPETIGLDFHERW